MKFPIKLDRSNLLLYREQFLFLIAAYGLERIDPISSIRTLFLPDSKVLNSTYEHWSHMNRIIKSWIFASVSSCASNYLVKPGTTTQY